MSQVSRPTWNGWDKGGLHICNWARPPRQIRRYRPDWRLGPDWSFGDFASTWGKGLGSKPLENMFRIAKYDGADYIWLNAQTSAQGFYLKHGFEPAGKVIDAAGIRHTRIEKNFAKIARFL